MKKIVLMMLIVVYSYAGADTVFFLESKFKKNAKEYYKLWAVGYCLGLFEVEKNTKFTNPGTPINSFNFMDDSKIGNIVYVLGFRSPNGVEPLHEIKAYIDKESDYFKKDRANHCLALLQKRNYPKGYHSLDDEIERVVKKYCKDCK